MMYSKNEIALMFLSSFDFMTSQKFEQVLEIIDEPENIFELSGIQQNELKKVLKNNLNEIISCSKDFDQGKFINALDKRGIECLTIISSNYPQKLLNLKNPPYVLYYVGDITLLNTKSIAVVGTRSPSSYGKVITEKLCKGLAENGITVISGLATGVDKIAHEATLDVNGKTVAVLGGGFDHIFPAININLARDIAKKGLIITEYYTEIKPTKYSFPIRNRIIAGICDAVLITEAKSGSGSLYTKEYADLLGKDTYCVPGNIISEKSEVPNRLIKNGSAICITDYKDILKDFGINEQKIF